MIPSTTLYHHVTWIHLSWPFTVRRLAVCRLCHGAHGRRSRLHYAWSSRDDADSNDERLVHDVQGENLCPGRYRFSSRKRE